MPTNVSALAALLLIGWGLASSLEPPNPAPPVLTAGRPVTGALGPEERLRHRLALDPGRRWVLQAEQLGIDLQLVLVGSGEERLVVDGRSQPRGEETLLVPEGWSGEVAVEVRAAGLGVAPGRYRLRLAALATTSEEDRRRLRATAELTALGRLAALGTTEDREAALAAGRRALESLQALGDRRGEAEVLEALADLAGTLGRPREGVAFYHDAIPAWEGLGVQERLAPAWNALGLLHWHLGEAEVADERFAEALALARELGDRRTEADARNNGCLVLHGGGAVRDALPCYREALALYQEQGDLRSEAAVLNNLAYAAYTLGEPEEAIAGNLRALALRRRIGDRAGEAQSLNNLAVVRRAAGDLQGALADYAEVRDLLRDLDAPRQEAAALHNLGVAYQSLGEDGRARLYLEEALALRRRIGDRRGELATLNALGRLARVAAEPLRAVEAHALALELARASGDRRGEGLALLYLGDARAAAGDLAAGLAELEGAVATLREVGDRGSLPLALLRRAETEAQLGRLEPALAALREAVALRRGLGDPAGEAATRAALARVLRRAGDLTAAHGEAAAAVALIESQPIELGGPELRSAAFGTQIELFGALLEVLADRHAMEPGAGHDRVALEVSERMRARVLRERVEVDAAALRRGVPPTLHAAREALLARLRLKTDREASLRRGAEQGRPQAAALALESQELVRRLEQVEAEIRAESPAWAALVQPAPLTAAEIQAQLDPDTVLLEVVLGEERSLGWVVTASSLRFFTLPGRAELEALTRRLFEELSAPPSGSAPRQSEPARVLARHLLAPAWEELRGRRLAVVADGALHSLPFAALPVPADPAGPWTEEGSTVPLVAHGEVVELASATVLAAQRRRLAGRPRAPELALVLADPVFDAGDVRLAGRAATEAAVPAADGRQGQGAAQVGSAPGGPALGRLGFSRREAEAITSLEPDRVRTLLGFDARRAALDEGLARYRFVHLATHGLVDLERPHLSGLMLARVDPEGRPLDGQVGLWDIYDLDLGADLVVLSGCRTALGREMRGEGLLGLSRGFLYAGAARVVASLWWVEDRATAALMEGFYRAMWEDGLRPAAALRRAQLELMRQRRYRDPFYWAPFVLHGDWR